MVDVTERALSFGSGAADYERYRPDYSDRLVVAVLDYAGRPLRTALEIGAGTGKATRVFFAAGIDVLATDPDPAMLAELRRHVPDEVQRLRDGQWQASVGTGLHAKTLGVYGLGRIGTLVFAAAAMHWTDPVDRWARVASLLVSGGVFASFGGPVDLSDPALEEAVRHAREPFLVDDEVASPDGTASDAPMQWPGSELRRSDEFTDVRQVEFERRTVMSAADYLGHLSTVSAYRLLPDGVRAEAFARIRDALPGEVGVTADIVLHLARLA